MLNQHKPNRISPIALSSESHIAAVVVLNTTVRGAVDGLLVLRPNRLVKLISSAHLYMWIKYTKFAINYGRVVVDLARTKQNTKLRPFNIRMTS